MKKTLLCATVAFICCGTNSSFAQMRMLPGTPTPAPRLAAAQITEAEIASPFDSLTGDLESSDFFDEGTLQDSPNTEPASDPTSLNVSRPDSRNVVDTLVDYSTLSNVPDCSVVPVDWSQSARTPNPVAEILLRERCVNGVWDGYQAERAAECAHMYAKMNGRNRCGTGACGVSGPCSVCAPTATCAKPRNRYLERQPLRSHLGAACDATPACNAAPSCDSAPCASGGCVSDATGTQLQMQPVSTLEIPRPEIKDNVASLRLPAIR